MKSNINQRINARASAEMWNVESEFIGSLEKCYESALVNQKSQKYILLACKKTNYKKSSSVRYF